MSDTNERSVASAGSFLVERCTIPVFLVDLRPGLFVDEKGFVGFKSEYFVNDPERMEVFCADTGEAYWGGTSSTNDRAAILVYPASINTRDQQPRTKEAARMSDENERSVASAGSGADGSDLVDRLSDLSGDVGRWGGKTIGEAITEIARLRLAIRRLADQDATLSVQGGNVTVTMDATLTTDERKAVELAVEHLENCGWSSCTLRGLLERTR